MRMRTLNISERNTFITILSIKKIFSLFKFINWGNEENEIATTKPERKKRKEKVKNNKKKANKKKTETFCEL